MSFSVLVLCLFLIPLLCDVANAETRTLSYTDFTGVSVGWGMRLDVTQSSSYSVQVTGDPDDLQDLKVEKRGKTLTFSMDRAFGWHHRGRISVSISMPTLTELDLSGGSNAHISMDTAGKSFSADLSGGSSLLGDLKCADASFELSGGSEVGIAGQGSNLKIDGSGGSEFKLRDFAVTDVTADMSGGSEAVVNMEGALRANQSGGSELTYYGSATIEENEASGGSKIRKGN